MDTENSNGVPFKKLAPKARRERAEQAFLECLENGEGEDFGLTYEKATSRRFGIRELEGQPGKFVVSVERHRAVAGCCHRPGFPMAARQTYMQEVLFDINTRQISDFGEEPVGLDVDIDALAEEQMGDCWPEVFVLDGVGGKRLTELSFLCWKFEGSSRKEAGEALEREFRALNYESTFECLDLSPEEKVIYTDRLRDASVGLLLERFDEAWEEPETLEDV